MSKVTYNSEAGNCTIAITTQYSQNYSDTDTPHWKPKGGHEFIIKCDADVLMYSNELQKHLTKMVSEQTTSHEKFEYLEHEVKFSEPTMLNHNELYSLINGEN